MSTGTTWNSTNSLELGTLVNNLGLDQYVPKVGDFVIWSGFFNTWYGIVKAYNKTDLDLIVEGNPFLLFDIDPNDCERYSKKIKLRDVMRARQGTWSILQHDERNNTNIWYI